MSARIRVVPSQPRNLRPAELKRYVPVRPGPCPECKGEDRFVYRDPDGASEVICPDCVRYTSEHDAA